MSLTEPAARQRRCRAEDCGLEPGSPHGAL